MLSKPDNVLTLDSFMSDMNCDTICKQEEKDGPICYCCGGPPTCEEAFLVCKDCGLNTHPTCLDYWPELTERECQSPWQCSDCKTCTVCNNSEYRRDLIICDACDKGFHIECHRPKLEESIDRILPLVCASCHDEGYRVAIDTLPSGNVFASSELFSLMCSL
uniref:PHD-type domain-containing protein n=1 Tax=Schistosoma mansoni TaxID=6183 RepID=A0A5K4F4L6_SCHMA